MKTKIVLLLSSFLFLALTSCGTTQQSQPDDELVSEIDSAASDNSSSGSSSTSSAKENNDAEKDFDDFGSEEEKTAKNKVEAKEAEQKVAENPPPQNPPPQEPPPAQEPPPIEQPIVEKNPPPQDLTPPASMSEIKSIKYLSSASGGTIEIKTSDKVAYAVRPNPGANQYVIEVQNAKLADSLKRPYIMKDFDGPFGAINAYQNAGVPTARIVVQMKGSDEPVVTQEGNTILVTPLTKSEAPPENQKVAANGKKDEDKPVDKLEADTDADEDPSNTDNDSYNVKAAKKSERILGARTLDEFLTGNGRFFGRPISIQTNDADIRDVISFIAEESGVNLVMGDDVDGKISLKLRQVPWDQALVIVMRARNLGYVRQGNVIRITKLQTLQAEAQAAKQIVDAQQTLTPLKVKVIPISYASVSDLATQIKPFLTTQRGQVVSDQRTTSLIITDTAPVLMKVERLVKELDIPPAQVMIEGKIVEATETFTRSLGVNWSLSGAPITVSNSGGFNGTPIGASSSLAIQNLNKQQITGSPLVWNAHVGMLDVIGDLDATLGLAQADSLVKIISSPRIVTMNKEKSEISQKSQVISITSSRDTQGNVTSTPKSTDVELKLVVTPQITAEGSVVLEVDLTRQFAGAVADSISLARPINTRQAKTKVLVPNGQTAVIGGIYQSDETETESGVPGLKDVPVLGWLFKSRVEDRTKNELLLFLTPRILNARDQEAATQTSTN